MTLISLYCCRHQTRQHSCSTVWPRILKLKRNSTKRSSQFLGIVLNQLLRISPRCPTWKAAWWSHSGVHACVWYNIILNKGTCRSFRICTDKLKHITDHMRSAILLIDHAQFSPHVLGRLSSMNSEIVVEFCSDIYAASLWSRCDQPRSAEIHTITIILLLRDRYIVQYCDHCGENSTNVCSNRTYYNIIMLQVLLYLI